MAELPKSAQEWAEKMKQIREGLAVNQVKKEPSVTVLDARWDFIERSVDDLLQQDS